ncbi:hypothetical protein E3P92_00689 [Wallemia ichthyophaga]|uniref:Uncharacterized protein n=1 Tax=Wallemia ichthyophaga TaxID=245174 RepID=A0A4T0JLH8_WALIC|nr:hypothetical protein E3P91_00297 [Wallemia ichthyophaga]TIB08384.1 hypothetical protein E3P93_03522 [Wallemia ichthyophaga]TIB08870.1 hypothetical protein E3P90_03499 [Wallemia ichthyophaga]TIB18125.1 hypothetical protein E3P92_00689 [Wallemia ichthyophaga]TIB19962.1 hypothetical protein E3P89_03517 [Wallemia ichthyophaga]
MLAMMNRERDKENKKLLYTENIAEISKKTKNALKKYKEKTETVIKTEWGFFVNPNQREDDAMLLASVKHISKNEALMLICSRPNFLNPRQIAMSDIWHLTSALSEGLEKAKTHYDGMDYFNTSIEGAATYKKSLDNLQLQHDRRKTVAAKAAAAADKRKAKAGSDKPNITYRTLYNKKRNM